MRHLVDTRSFLVGSKFHCAFYETAPWLVDMMKFANPWHRRRRWQVEIGFKLLAVARGQKPTRWFVESPNQPLGRKTTMKTALLALAASCALTSGCAAAPPKKAPAVTAATPCQNVPQWTVSGPDGAPLGIFICFGADNQLLYQVRPLPPAPAPAAAPVAPAAAKKARKTERRGPPPANVQK